MWLLKIAAPTCESIFEQTRHDGIGFRIKFFKGLILEQFVACFLLADAIFIPRHTLVSGYYVIPFGVCPSVRPSVRLCSPFPIDNLSIYSRNFFKFCIHIVIGDEWYGIVNGQNPSIFNGATALIRIGKMVSGLLFLYCS